MTAQLFPDLPEQREGPITVDGRTLAQCVACEGEGSLHIFGTVLEPCPRCNGGGLVLVRA